MRVLSITAQKPNSTGSGVYLTEIVGSLAHQGHAQAVVFGAMPDDEIALRLHGQDASDIVLYPVRFESDALPFPIAGMSDDMPYRATRYRDFSSEMLEQFVAAYEAEISRAIAEFQPDLIICHHLYIVTAVAAHLDLSCPVVAICHGTDIRQMEQHDLHNAYVREGVGQLDRIFALTAEQAEDIKACYGVASNRVSVLGTGFNSRVFYPDPDVVKRRDSVLYVGKVCAKKGVHSLIRALDLAQGTGNLQSKFIGGFNNVEEHALIEEQAEGASTPIKLAGKVEQEELVQSYQESKVFVLPSFFEGLPLVLIEAMACGCVAVCTDLPGIRPWLEEVAPEAPVLFVEPPRLRNLDEPYLEDLPRFENELARAIERSLAMEPRPEAVECLSWDALVGRLLAAL